MHGEVRPTIVCVREKEVGACACGYAVYACLGGH